MKRWIRLVVIAVVIAALIVALILVRNAKEREASEEFSAQSEEYAEEIAANRVQILDTNRDLISGIEIERGGESLVLTAAADGTFDPEYEYDVRFDDSRINRIVGTLTSLFSSRVIDEAPENLADYGLANPAMRATATLSEGEPVELLIGNRLPGGVGFYVSATGSLADEASPGSVYAASTTWISPLYYTLDDLRVKVLPQVNPQEMNAIRIDTLEGRTVRAELITQPDPELVGSSLAVVEPFARVYAASANWLEALAQALSGVAILTYVDDDPAADLGAYGLNPPRASFRITDSNNALDILVGDPAPGGRYAARADGGSVFVATGFQEIVSVDPFETLSSFIYIISIDLMDHFVVETPTEYYRGQFTRVPSEDPEEDAEATFTLNDVELQEDLYKDLYQWLIGLLADTEAVNPQPGPPDMTITYTLTTGAPDVTLSFVPYDTNYYAVFRDGSSEFLVTRTKVARLLAALKDPASIAD